MKNINVFSNRLDESNGIVEHVLEMKTTKKTPWFLRFAPKAKGLVSFVQNLLSPLTQKEASAAAAVLVGIGFLKTKKAVSAVAAAVVGVGLLCSPIESVQGEDSRDPGIINFVNLQFVDDYYLLGSGTLESVDVDITDFGSWLDATKVQYSIYVESGYAVVTFNPVWPSYVISPFVHKEKNDGWVEILVWLGDYFDFPSGSPVLGMLMFTTVREHVMRLTCLWKEFGLMVPVFFTAFHETSGVHVD